MRSYPAFPEATKLALPPSQPGVAASALGPVLRIVPVVVSANFLTPWVSVGAAVSVLVQSEAGSVAAPQDRSVLLVER